MVTTEDYVNRYLQSELWEVINSGRNNDTPELSNAEKTLIYKYSNDGYESINTSLRKGKPIQETEFGSLLAAALRKMKSYGVVFRSVYLSGAEVEPYREAFRQNQPITEIAFSSTSRSLRVAEAYGGNAHFGIYSKNGKNIERVSKFGIYGVQNEQEVLFAPPSVFNVLAITESLTGLQIIMEEQ